MYQCISANATYVSVPNSNPPAKVPMYNLVFANTDTTKASDVIRLSGGADTPLANIKIGDLWDLVAAPTVTDSGDGAPSA